MMTTKNTMMTKKKIKFYDTCSLILAADRLFKEEDDLILISSITLGELEQIKNASNKDSEVKQAARKLLHELDKYYGSDLYEIIQFKEKFLNPIKEKGLEINNDTKIISCGISYEKDFNVNIEFITNDLSCKNIAHMFFEQVSSVIEEQDDYEGYKEVYLTQEEMAKFYSNQDFNEFNLYINEYLIIYDNETKKPVDQFCWTGKTHRRVNYKIFSSKLFGEIKPMKNDVYQMLAADSLTYNKITMLKGPAGSGKTSLSLGYLIHKLEYGQIDRIIIFCNTVATKNSARLGFYPGSRDEKLLDSQIGNLLISKLGSRLIVEDMIEKEELVLLPLSDIRGYDTSGMRAGIYISEAQNMDVNLMKLTLQRIGEDSICIIDGDCKAQVDLAEFSGSNNGMCRASKIFRGEDIYGEITLKTIHRSRIAKIAESL